jgi:osmotically-inducible protein OsmY
MCLVLPTLFVALVLPACASSGATTSTRPADVRSVSDEELKARVSSALASSSAPAAKAIAVDVSGGVVRLSGKVADSYELQDLGALVRSVPGVRTIRFSVQIQPPGESRPQGR